MAAAALHLAHGCIMCRMLAAQQYVRVSLTETARPHVAVVPGGEAGHEAPATGVAHEAGGIRRQQASLPLPLPLLLLLLLHLLLVLHVLRLKLCHLQLCQARWPCNWRDLMV